jgi:hypothetical protein
MKLLKLRKFVVSLIFFKPKNIFIKIHLGIYSWWSHAAQQKPQANGLWTIYGCDSKFRLKFVKHTIDKMEPCNFFSLVKKSKKTFQKKDTQKMIQTTMLWMVKTQHIKKQNIFHYQGVYHPSQWANQHLNIIIHKTCCHTKTMHN